MKHEVVEKQGFIKGEVLFTIYQNEENHFSILKVKIHETNEAYDEKEIVLKGHLSTIQKGVVYHFHGQLDTHPRFGVQYDVTSFKTYVPETKDAVIAYLSSDLFPGVGVKTAENIVNYLGENAIETILQHPDRAFNIPNMKQKTIKSLVQHIQDHQGFEQIAIKLSKYGIGLKKAQEIYKLYKQETMKLIQENPYQFLYDVDGISFIIADKIAELNGIEKTSIQRIRASTIYALQLSVVNGDVFLPLDVCLAKMKKILQEPSITEDQLLEQVTYLSTRKHVILQEERVYLPSLYYAEDYFTGHLKRIMNHTIKTEVPDAELMQIIGDIEEKEVLSYGSEQFNAMKQALASKVMILTGGPGTGKTTVIKGILAAYAEIHRLSLKRQDYKKAKDYPFILTAPTGRAAKRLQESTGLKAFTIHRLLGWDGNESFEKNEHDQLSGNILIVDEFSMVDTWLANHLFKAIPSDMQVLLVGDEDQLPSVGPGQVLSDLLKSECIPFTTLNEVYRQKEGSKIIHLAHQTKHNVCTEEDLHQDKDFSFIPAETEQIKDVITTIISRAIHKGYSLKNIQILAPMYKTNAGIHAINKQIQELVNPKTNTKRERSFNDVVFRVGDRIIQLVNQPEDGVYNGDIGEIVQIFSAKETEEKQEQIVVEFDDTEVVYTRKNYLNIMHAYCISIHKAQGSEFPIVIFPVVRAYHRMLRKNLLYTAITRAKRSLVMCGDQCAFLKGIETLDTNKRYTTLKEKLKLKLSDHEVVQEEYKEPKGTTDASLDEAEFSPYDFM